MESVLRPRDIQARIRAGEAPEDVAAAAQTSVERIIGYATPVLAERAYQAQLAQRASVRRRSVAGAGGTVGNLGGAVTAHLETLEVDPESVEWDSWRREDGRWTVTASYVQRGDERLACFAYDAAGRFVIAEDDEARALVGERSATAPAEQPIQSPAVPRLRAATPLDDDPMRSTLDAPVDESADDGQEELGEDAIDVVMGRPTTSHQVLADEVTLDLTEATRPVRSRPSGPAGADTDWMSTQASERPAASGPTGTVEPDAPRPDGAPKSDPWDSPDEDETVEGDAREEEEQEAETLFDVPAPVAVAVATPAADPGSSEDQPSSERPQRASRSKRRSSVPSWDEIMFGSPSGD